MTHHPQLTDDTPGAEGRKHDVIVLELGRYGSQIAQGLAVRGLQPLGIDFNPETVRSERGRGFDVLFGDASDPEFLAHLPLVGVRMVISATQRSAGPLTEADCHATVIRALRHLGFQGPIAVTLGEDEAAVTG